MIVARASVTSCREAAAKTAAATRPATRSVETRTVVIVVRVGEPTATHGELSGVTRAKRLSPMPVHGKDGTAKRVAMSGRSAGSICGLLPTYAVHASEETSAATPVVTATTGVATAGSSRARRSCSHRSRR